MSDDAKATALQEQLMNVAQRLTEEHGAIGCEVTLKMPVEGDEDSVEIVTGTFGPEDEDDEDGDDGDDEGEDEDAKEEVAA